MKDDARDKLNDNKKIKCEFQLNYNRETNESDILPEGIRFISTV